MKKVFEALEKIKEQFGCDPAYYGLNLDFEILQQALTELQAIKEAKPSEAMEYLVNIEADLTGLPKHVTEYDDIFDSYLEDIWNNIDTIEQSLLKAQEFEKAYEDVKALPLESLIETYKKDVVLEVFTKEIEQLKKENAELKEVLRIIFEKNVNIFWLKECKSLEEYNYNIADYMKLTEEEFNLLKRWIEK